MNSPALPSEHPDRPVALLLTDLVDSAALAQRLGDEAMARVWTGHDRVARDLLRIWRGREIDKTDGFLLMFAEAADALGYVLAYHRALHALETTMQVALPPGDGAPPRLQARAGLHVGEVTVRENPAADVALGAKPLEVDGVTKPLAARVMSTALGGQTLITAAARDALGEVGHRVVSHGHWRVKGLPVPLELFEVGEPSAPFTPPPDADKVYRVVRQGDLWLPARDTRHTLPAERDAFVGRRSTLQELARRFDRGARLVSLLGIGGCGKTRVATRFGWQWLGDFPGGVWFCDLAAARTLEGLYSAVAQGLDVPLGPDDPVQQLGHAIAGRGPCLVVLDNFEQLARHAESTVGQWLERAGAARFLVTTREVLGISGEDAVALAPMQDADAQALFMRRAASARRDFEPSADDEAAIGPLVKLLDGLPLAIELAAARVRTLTPRALLARMSERFKLLSSSGSRVDRQATLRATFDWSWDLLSPAERAALAQLSVFENGFSIEAAEAVIDLNHLPQAPWTVDAIQSLVDKSFVRSLPGERFDLLGSVQDYAHEKLDAETPPQAAGGTARQSTQARHSAWFAALGPQRATEQRCIELDNLVAACRRATLAGSADTAANALDGAWAALSLRGPYQAGLDLAQALCALPALRSRTAARGSLVLGSVLEAMGRRAQATPALEAALQHARDGQDVRCEAAACVRLGALHGREGRSELARTELAAALQGALDLGDAELECAALNGLGTLEFERGQLPDAQPHYEAALARARSSGDRRWQGNLLSNLANLHANVGRLELAGTLSEEALAIARQLGDRQREGTRLSNLGMLHYLQGRLDAAETACRDALAAARELGHARLECTVLANLGLVQAAAGRTAEAVASHQPALALARQLGNRRAEAQILGHLGVALARLGQHGAARQHVQQGLAILRAGSDLLSLGLMLCGVAECEALDGQPDAAAAALSEARALAAQSQAGHASELGLALARLQTMLPLAS